MRHCSIVCCILQRVTSHILFSYPPTGALSPFSRTKLPFFSEISPSIAYREESENMNLHIITGQPPEKVLKYLELIRIHIYFILQILK